MQNQNCCPPWRIKMEPGTLPAGQNERFLHSAFCLWKSPFPSFLGRRSDQFDRFGHFPADLFLENFPQGDVGHAEVGDIGHQRPAQPAAAGIELAHTARDQVDQHVWVADLFGGLLAEFSVHNFRSKRAKDYIDSTPLGNKKLADFAKKNLMLFCGQIE